MIGLFCFAFFYLYKILVTYCNIGRYGFSVVRDNAKIHILKQFTTVWGDKPHRQKVVRDNAKIHILKQFTTVQENKKK